MCFLEVPGDELGDNGDGLGGVHLEVGARAEEGPVTHAPAVEVTPILITQTLIPMYRKIYIHTY